MTLKEAIKKSLEHHEENLKLMEGAVRVLWDEHAQRSLYYLAVEDKDKSLKRVDYGGDHCTLCQYFDCECENCVTSCNEDDDPWWIMRSALLDGNLPAAIEAEKQLIEMLRRAYDENS